MIRNNILDFAISIAVVHHFSTPERRRKAINEILRTVKEGGEVMIYVWALEQEKVTLRAHKRTQRGNLIPKMRWFLGRLAQKCTRGTTTCL